MARGPISGATGYRGGSGSPGISSGKREYVDAQRQAEHPGDLGRRHRHHESELLQRRADGLSHPQHRPYRRRRHALHRLLRRAELHRGTLVVHDRPKRVPHRAEQGRHARLRRRHAAQDPTIAGLLKTLGYATGQFGKNHLGDLNKHLPTVHGFDEFFGNLYHLNAEEEPEHPDYPTDPDAPARLRPARCHQVQGHRKDDSEVITTLRQAASRPSKTPAR